MRWESHTCNKDVLHFSGDLIWVLWLKPVAAENSACGAKEPESGGTGRPANTGGIHTPPCILPALLPAWQQYLIHILLWTSHRETLRSWSGTSCQQSSPCHLCILCNSVTRPGEMVWNTPSAGSIRNRKFSFFTWQIPVFICCTSSTCQSPWKGKMWPLPWATCDVSRQDSFMWRKNHKDLNFLTQGHVILGGHRARQREPGGVHNMLEQMPSFLSRVKGLPWEAHWGLACNPRAWAGAERLCHARKHGRY